MPTLKQLLSARMCVVRYFIKKTVYKFNSNYIRNIISCLIYSYAPILLSVHLKNKSHASTHTKTCQDTNILKTEAANGTKILYCTTHLRWFLFTIFKRLSKGSSAELTTSLFSLSLSLPLTVGMNIEVSVNEEKMQELQMEVDELNNEQIDRQSV